jgi:hypothetical protein
MGDAESPARRVQEQTLVDRLVGERLKQFADALPTDIRARTLPAVSARRGRLGVAGQLDDVRDERTELVGLATQGGELAPGQVGRRGLLEQLDVRAQRR